MSDPQKVKDGHVVSMEYSLHVDGELLDSSTGGDPLQFLQGAGNIIPGLERELYGMGIGENKKVIVQPADGYGEFDEEAFIEVPRNQFPEGFPIEEGIQLELRDQESGQPMMAIIDSIEGDMVRIDMNHPLAGAELHFDVTVVGLRDATPEEVEHGHVHEDGFGDGDDEDEEGEA